MSDVCAMDVTDIVAWEKELEASGTSLAVLMERAGAALADAILDIAREYAETEDAGANAASKGAASTTAATVVILAGNGNNGGDGWAAARLLCQAKAPLTIILVSAKELQDITAHPAHEEAIASQQILEQSSCATIMIAPDEQELTEAVMGADIIVDAVLGTGFSGAHVRSPFNRWIEVLNTARKQHPQTVVLSADCPSGLNAQTAEAASPTVKADMTITMLAQKTGFTYKEAEPYVGRIQVAHIDRVE